MKNTLGLPLEYQELPEYFDAHNVNEETESKNSLVEKLLNKHSVKTVLDLTCGTGSQVFYLSERGYDVTGSDFSPSLLKIARAKASSIKKEVQFIDGDMRHIQVGQFDAAITMFNAIGHLTKDEFAEALQNIHSNLQSDGIYVFDIFNLEAMTDEVISTFVMDINKLIDGVRIHNTQYSEIDLAKSLLTSYDTYTIYKDATSPEIKKNTFSLQIYSAAELESILYQNGFRVIEQSDIAGNDFIPKESLNILIVAKKLPA